MVATDICEEQQSFNNDTHCETPLTDSPTPKHTLTSKSDGLARDSVAMPLVNPPPPAPFKCTQTKTFGRRILSEENKKRNIDICVCFFKNGFNVDHREYHRRMVTDLKNLHIEFHSPDDFKYSDHIFKLLCEHRAAPIDKMSITSLALPYELPAAMKEFFSMIPVAELTLVRCYLPGQVSFPNVVNLKIDRPTFTAFGAHNSALVVLKSKIGCETFFERQAEARDKKVIEPYFQHFPSTLFAERIECSTLFITSKKTLTTIPIEHLQAIKKLSLVVRDRNNVSKKIYQYLQEAENLECVRLTLDHNAGFFKVDLFKTFAQIKKLRKLELHDPQALWEDRTVLVSGLLEMTVMAPTLKEIEFILNDLNTFPAFLKNLYDRFLTICQKNDRQMKLIFKLGEKWMRNILLKFGVSGEQLLENEKHLILDFVCEQIDGEY